MTDRRHLRFFHPLFDRRAGKPIVLPLIAAVLGLFLMWRDARANTIKGVMNDGTTAFVCQRFDRGPLLEFCVYFPR